MEWLEFYFVDVVDYEEYVGEDELFKKPTYKGLVKLKCRLDVNKEVLNQDEVTLDTRYTYNLKTNYPIKPRSLVNGQNVLTVRKLTGFDGKCTYIATVGGENIND